MKEEVNFLGILLNSNHKDLIAHNYDQIIEKMKHQCDLWATFLYKFIANGKTEKLARKILIAHSRRENST